MEMGRTRAEAQRGEREDWECRNVESAFCNCLGQQAQGTPKSPLRKGLDQCMDPIHSQGQVETATAPSAGGPPDGAGEVRLGKRLFSDSH